MEPMVCPFNCSGVGKCVDPLASSMGSWPYDGGMLGPMAMGGVGPGGRSGADAASISTAIGPMQDQSPVDAGFMCACDAGECSAAQSNSSSGRVSQQQQQQDLSVSAAAAAGNSIIIINSSSMIWVCL